MAECEAGLGLCIATWWDALLTLVAVALGDIIAKLPALAQFLEGTVKLVNGVFAWGGAHLQAIASLAAVSFGIYKWWWNRESMLMRRMTAVIKERDWRLQDARGDLVRIMSTPGPGKKVTVPLFTVRKLRRVLQRRNWLPLLSAKRLPTATDRALAEASKRIHKLITSAEEIAASRRQELFTATMLQGAIAAARAERHTKLEQQAAQSNLARRQFEDALAIKGFESDRLAHECLGIQLIKLNETERAVGIFDALEQRALANSSAHDRAVEAGRSAFFRAQISIRQDAPAGSITANVHLIRAVNHLAGQGPFNDPREQLAFARAHELHACVRTHLNYDNRNASLDEAERRYEELLALPALRRQPLHWLLWFLPTVRQTHSGNKEILQEAKTALARLADYGAGKRACVCGKDRSE